ncbi:neuroglobin-like isoform X1 [Ascaphus truei]|uniref:neuroglobin-like isoform X1 n=1 Tax=Ascaphus truei TaxID=8439 RepID=UPI003F593529
MGCALSGLGWQRRASVDPAKPEPLPTLNLSQEQHRLLVESWKLIREDIAKVGVIMFIRLFETHPECKDVFFMFRDVDDLRGLGARKDLRTHGLRVLSFVEKSVARIGQSARLEEMTLDLGRSHYAYNAPPHYYQYVGTEFISAVRPVLNEKLTPDVEEAWQHLFTYICTVMKWGYQEEERKSFGGRSGTPRSQQAREATVA